MERKVLELEKELTERKLSEKKRQLKKALKRLKARKVKVKISKIEAAEKGRARLLKEIVARREGRPVNILRRVSDTIPNVLIKRRDEEIKPTFFSRKWHD